MAPVATGARRAVRVVLVAALAAAAMPLLAQSGGPYQLTRSTIDAGGGRSSGGVYELHGSIGQHDAAPPLTGGTLELQPGFWAGATADQGAPLPPDIFRDGFESP